MMTDPIADMLTRVRNALQARHASVLVPASATKIEMARILTAEGFIKQFEVVKAGPGRMIRVNLLYREKNEPGIAGLKRVSKPGLRVYVQKSEIPRVYGGLGIAILSTSKGIMTGHEAWRQKLGGEVLCHVW
jgi:small subunit ribosomal protein S8